MKGTTRTRVDVVVHTADFVLDIAGELVQREGEPAALHVYSDAPRTLTFHPEHARQMTPAYIERAGALGEHIFRQLCTHASEEEAALEDGPPTRDLFVSEISIPLGVPDVSIKAGGAATFVENAQRPMKLTRIRFAARFDDNEGVVDHALVRIESLYVGARHAEAGDLVAVGLSIALTLVNDTGSDIIVNAWVDGLTMKE